jgi:hypothetical protein
MTAVDPHGRQAGLPCGEVIVKQALRDVQELAVADAEPPGFFGQSCEVAR